MRAFHIDLNHANPTAERLQRWLGHLAGIGYDTILWEVEDAVAWQTIAPCAAPDAFTREEFRAVLAEGTRLGLTHIPLLQTLGHCEYVLRNKAYAHLTEIPGSAAQYCPSHAEVVPLLHRLIAEYIEVFGDITRFHLGMDEATHLGSCPVCAAKVSEIGLTGLYAEHLQALRPPLTERGIQPMIWADMALSHQETIAALPRDVVLCDWNYFTWAGQERAWLWTRRDPVTLHNEPVDPHSLTADERQRFGQDLWPHGEAAAFDPCYTATQLARHGYPVVACPTTSCYGDNVFAPRFWDKLRNTVTWARRGAGADLEGSIVTSWTVHQHPWELQSVLIDAGALALAYPAEDAACLAERLVARTFGCIPEPLIRAWELLSEPCLFSQVFNLGYSKSTIPSDASVGLALLDRLFSQNHLARELERCCERRLGYLEAGTLIAGSQAAAGRGHELLALWDLAARNLAERAAGAACLIRWRTAGEAAADAPERLTQLRTLRAETAQAYRSLGSKPLRLAQQMQWLYGPVESALEIAATGGRS